MQPFSLQGPVHTAATSASQALSDIWAANSATDPAWDTQNRDRSFCTLRILFLLVIITEVNNMNCMQRNLMWLKIAVPCVFSGYPQGWSQRGQRYMRNKHLPAATFFSRAQSASTENKVTFPSDHFNIKKIPKHCVSTIFHSLIRQLLRKPAGVWPSYSSRWCTGKICYMKKV